MFTTKEEDLFYEPFAENGIRELVVAGVRNSMLEIAASESCGEFKMPEPLDDKTVRRLTSSAIEYFSACDLQELMQEARSMEYEDVYEAAAKKYPLAWNMLMKTALLGKREYDFKKIAEMDEKNPEEGQWVKSGEKKSIITDGFTLEFDDYLKDAVGEVASGKLDALYVDSFKMLSRNFEKILHVLQIILEHDKAFATCNYYISNGHLEKRKIILRAAHTEKEIFEHSRMWETAPNLLGKLMREGL